MNELLFFAEILGILLACRIALLKNKEALFVLNALFIWLANFFVLKQITLFGLNVTASDMFAVGGLYTINLIQHHYGKAEAKKALYLTFGTLVLYALCSYIHLLYTPCALDFAHPFYQALCETTPRLALSSMVVFWIVQRLDLETFALAKKWLQNRTVAIVVNIAFLQLIDTVAFSILALWGVLNSLKEIILFSYAIKMLTLGIIGVGDLSFVNRRKRHV